MRLQFQVTVSPKLPLLGCSITSTEKKGCPLVTGNLWAMEKRGHPFTQGLGVGDSRPTQELHFQAGQDTHCSMSYLGQGWLNLPFTYPAKHTSSSQPSKTCTQPSRPTSLLTKDAYPPSPTGEILFNLSQCLETMLVFLLEKEEDADVREQSALPSEPALQRLPKAKMLLAIPISFCKLLVLGSLLWFRGYITLNKKFCFKF